MKKGLNFFEPEDTPEQIRVGLRTIKTVVAVFISAVMGYIREQQPFIAMIAAVLCVQPNTEQTLIFSLNRLLGTLIGGAAGVVAVFIAELGGFGDLLLAYYSFVSIMLIPLIILAQLIRKPSIAAFVCIVFISVTVGRQTDISPLLAAIERMLDTAIGIAAALGVNLALPYVRHSDTDERIESL